MWRDENEWNLEAMPVLEEPAPEPEPEPEPEKPRKVRKVKVHPLEGLVVRGSKSAYFLVQDGKRRLIPSVEAFYQIGLRPVLVMGDEDLEEIPAGDPFPNPAAEK